MDASVKGSAAFRRGQYSMLAATILGYTLFYFLRKNLSLAMPGLAQDYGVTKSTLGLSRGLRGGGRRLERRRSARGRGRDLRRVFPRGVPEGRSDRRQGPGNFETMDERMDKPIAFFFLAKCPVVCRTIGAEPKTIQVVNRGSSLTL